MMIWAKKSPHFREKYLVLSYLKHNNGKIFSWRSLSWKLRSKSMPYGKVMTLWMRTGVCGAFQDKSWSFLVHVEATKPVLFRVNCQALRQHFMHAVEVATRDDRRRTAHASVAYQPPSLVVVLGRGRGSGGPVPENFFHLRWLNPLKFNPQAARLWYANKTKGRITLKHCAVLKQFTTHSYWEVTRWT